MVKPRTAIDTHVNWMLSFHTLARVMQRSLLAPFVELDVAVRAFEQPRKERRDRYWLRHLAFKDMHKDQAPVDEAAEKAARLLKAGLRVPDEAKKGA